jgi:hypothetical protein
VLQIRKVIISRKPTEKKERKGKKEKEVEKKRRGNKLYGSVGCMAY